MNESISNFDFSTMPDLDDRLGWQRFVITKTFQLACHKDEKVRGKALDMLARFGNVALHQEKTEVNISMLTPVELEQKINDLIDRINRKSLGAIEDPEPEV